MIDGYFLFFFLFFFFSFFLFSSFHLFIYNKLARVGISMFLNFAFCIFHFLSLFMFSFLTIWREYQEFEWG